MRISRQVTNASIMVEGLRHEAGVASVTINSLSSETQRNGIVRDGSVCTAHNCYQIDIGC